MPLSVKERVMASIGRSQKDVFLRADFERFGSYRQVSRALADLEKESVVQRSGYGVYLRPKQNRDVRQTIQAIKDRLPGSRMKRLLEIGESVVLVGATREPAGANAHDLLDVKKLSSAKEVLETNTLAEIRRRSLANLDRWKSLGVWVSAHEEWRALLQEGSDQELIGVMTGTDQRSNRLRQSPPYTGLLNRNEK